MRTRPVLVYDGDCGFCTTSVAFAGRRVHPRCDVRPGSSWSSTSTA